MCCANPMFRVNPAFKPPSRFHKPDVLPRIRVGSFPTCFWLESNVPNECSEIPLSTRIRIHELIINQQSFWIFWQPLLSKIFRSPDLHRSSLTSLVRHVRHVRLPPAVRISRGSATCAQRVRNNGARRSGSSEMESSESSELEPWTLRDLNEPVIDMGVSINGVPPNGWFMINGKSHWSGWFGGTPI